MKKKNKKVLIIGGKNKSKALALSLLKQGYDVCIINNDYEYCMKLAEIKNLCVIHGDGTKPYILDEADAKNCDIAIALMNKDSDNLVACQICKKQFNISKTVSLVGDPNKTDFFYQMGVDSVVCSVLALTGIIQQQAFIDEMSNVIPVGKGKVQIVEARIFSDSIIANKKLWEITLPKECIVGCILRDDSFIIPRGDTRILEQDILVIITGNINNLDEIHLLTGGK